MQATIKQLKKEPWYKEQLLTRKFMIQSHSTFCCPVTGNLLDQNESFIIGKHIVHEEALQVLLDKAPNYTKEKLIASIKKD